MEDQYFAFSVWLLEVLEIGMVGLLFNVETYLTFKQQDNKCSDRNMEV